MTPPQTPQDHDADEPDREPPQGEPGGAAPQGAAPQDFDTTLELVRRGQDGDQRAINDLFARYHDRVKHIVRLKMGRVLSSYLDSEDVVQEALMAAFLHLDRFELRDQGSFLHWVAKIAENRIRRAAEYHHAQKRDRRREKYLEGMRAALSSGELRFDPADDMTRVDEKLARKDELARVEECVQSLKDDYREVFVARHYEWGEPKWDEISKELGKNSPDAARMLYARAEVEVIRCLRRKSQGQTS